MPTISSVIYNRLEKSMPLQMDGTLNYGEYSHIAITSAMIKNDNTSYNTYKNKGIPNDPICAVEFEAIKSAIFPKNTNYLYFVKSFKNNGHLFSESLKQHNKNVKVYKRDLARKKIKEQKQSKLLQQKQRKALQKLKKEEQKKQSKKQNKLHNETKTSQKVEQKSLKELWKNVNTER